MFGKKLYFPHIGQVLLSIQNNEKGINVFTNTRSVTSWQQLSLQRNLISRFTFERDMWKGKERVE